MHLYGGAQQVAFLLPQLAAMGVDNLLVCPPGAAIGAHLRKAGIRVAESRCGGDADLRFVARLAGLLHRERPDLVHLHSRRGADLLGGFAAKLAGVPAVLSRRVDNRESRLAVALKYRLYERVICISQGIADVLAGEGLPPAKLRVARSALDPAPWRSPAPRAKLCREFGVDGQALLVGVLAQLIERKGHCVLFEALRRRSVVGPLQLLVFGQGPLRETLEREVAAAGLGACVRFAGFRADLPRWLGALDLVVHPARMEGLGVSLLQASAAGVPVIASRVGGIPEAVRDGVNGLLVPPGDADALAAAIDALAADPARRRALGDAGRALIEREFSVAAMARANLAVYEELIGSQA